MSAKLIATIAFLLISGLALAQAGQMQEKIDRTGNEAGKPAGSMDRNGNVPGANGSDANGAETPSGGASDANAKTAPSSTR